MPQPIDYARSPTPTFTPAPAPTHAWKRLRRVSLWIALVAVAAFVAPFVMFFVVGMRYPGDADAGFLVVIPATVAWGISLLSGVAGIVTGLVGYKKYRGDRWFLDMAVLSAVPLAIAIGCIIVRLVG